MFKTGNSLIDLFSQILVFLPLLPVSIILFRKIYGEEALNYLLILCLLNFCQYLVLDILPLPEKFQPSVAHLFSLIEFVFLVQVFKSSMNRSYREYINFVAIGLVSAITTYYLVSGISRPLVLPGLLQHVIIIMLATYCLITAIRNDNLQIFYDPLFWIATGTLFYFMTIVLLEILGECCASLRASLDADKMLMTNIALLARYFFYSLAALMDIKKDGSENKESSD